MKHRLLCLPVCFVLLAAVARSVDSSNSYPNIPAQYAAVAIGQSGSTAGKTFTLTIYLDALTTDGNADELASTLKHKGQNGLVRAMEGIKDTGRVTPSGSVGTGVRFVRIRPTKDGGQQIVVATNRPISFPELYRGSRSRDYPISILELNIDAAGKGTGSFAPLCRVKFNKNNELVVEHYGQKPFRLVNVYRQK